MEYLLGHTHYILCLTDPDSGGGWGGGGSSALAEIRASRVCSFFLVGDDSSTSEDSSTIEYSVRALTSANWFDDVMTSHDVSPNITLLNITTVLFY